MEREFVPAMMSKRNVSLSVLLLAVCLVYSNFFSNSFHFDDFHTVTDNPAVRSLGNMPRIFTDTTAFSVLPANQTYRPVVTASLALDYALGHGYSPFWFHLSTLIWFLVLIAALFFLVEHLLDRVQRSTANHWLALGVAAWFGLHPAMAETVNYVIQRGDLYCTLGCVAALLLYARYPQARRYGLYLLPFAVAMLSKPPAAIFPLLLLFYAFFFEGERKPMAARWRRSLLAALPSAAVTALLLALQSKMTPTSYVPTMLSPGDYRLTQPFVWLRYCGALFLPLHLNVDTDLQPISAFNIEAAAGLFFVCLLLLLVFLASRKPRLYPIVFGLLWFVLTQLPTSLYTLSEVENDHRMFFSFPGLMLAVVWALYLGYERLRGWMGSDERQRAWLQAVAVALCAVLLCGYAYGAHRRNVVWHSEESLWADDVVKSPHNGRGLMIYGLTKMNAGDYRGASELFKRALQYTPNYPTLEINLGIVNGLLADAGQPALASTAEAHFERALRLAPADDLPHAYYGRWLLTHGHVPEAISQLESAVALNGQRPMQRDFLLKAYADAGNMAQAHALAQATLAMMPEDASSLAVSRGLQPTAAPTSAVALINASLAAYRAGQFQESIDRARQALAIDPHSAEAWNNLGAGSGAMGQWDVAIAAEQQALRVSPSLEIAQSNLRSFLSHKTAETAARNRADASVANAETAADYVNSSFSLNQQGRYEESIRAARKALALDPQSAAAWNNIAANQEALHQWDLAITAAQQAVALQPDFQLAKNNLAWAKQQKIVQTK